MALLLPGYEDWGLLFLRVIVGIIFVYHGLPKFKNGIKTANKMGKGIGIPSWLFMLIGFGEFLLGISAIIGYLTQIAGIYFSLIMIAAIYLKTVKWKVSFSARKGTGWEFDLLILAAALGLVFLGAGNFSIDALAGFWP